MDDAQIIKHIIFYTSSKELFIIIYVSRKITQTTLHGALHKNYPRHLYNINMPYNS